MAIATWLLVLFEVVSLTQAMISQYPAWSVGRSNLQALAGKTCGLAEDVLVELDPNAGMLAPVTAPLADALGAGLSEAFTPNGIPADVTADPVMERPGDRSFLNDDGLITGSEPGTEGHHGRTGNQRLPRPAALQPGPGPYTGAGQLASRRAGARHAAVGLVPAAHQRAAGQGAAAGGDGGRAIRLPRGPVAVGHRRASGRRTPRWVDGIRRRRCRAGLA